MQLAYLKPNTKGTTVVTLSVFTNKGLGLVEEGQPASKKRRPADFSVGVTKEGFFDLDTIQKVFKEKFDPISNTWKTDNNLPVLFAPMSATSVKELKEADVFVPEKKAAEATKNAPTWTPCISLADLGSPGRSQPTVAKLKISPLKDGEESPTKLPGFPISVKVGDVISGCGKSTGNYTKQDFSRFCVGIWNKESFHCGLPIPIGFEPETLLAMARSRYSENSGWIYNPPSAIEFQTSPEVFRRMQKNCSNKGKLPLELSLCRLTYLQYCTDGGEACPEAVNCTMYLPNPKSSVQFAKRPAVWVMDWDGNPIKKGSPKYPETGGGKSSRGNDAQPAIYIGLAVATRFWMITKAGEYQSTFNGCTAYGLQLEWYEELIKEHRPDLFKDVWERPSIGEEGDFYFMASDWCMRNDNNVKSGSKAAKALGMSGIDLYSQPKRSMYQWVIGAYRQNFSQTYKEFPGIIVHKHKVASEDLTKLIEYNVKMKAAEDSAPAEVLKVPMAAKKG